MKITRALAEAQGYTIDTHANLGYTGPRFNPVSTVNLFTDLEADMKDALEQAHATLKIQHNVIIALQDTEADQKYKDALLEGLADDYPATEQLVWHTLMKAKA